MIIGVWALAIFGLSLHQPEVSAKIEKTKVETSQETVSYSTIELPRLETKVAPEEVAQPKTQIQINFVTDLNTFSENVDYEAILVNMNKSYAKANVEFILGTTEHRLFPTANFKRLLAPKLASRAITVYVLGVHSEDIIGLGILNGYSNGHSAVAVDLTMASTVLGQANMISHEIGHLFGLEHTHKRSMMGEELNEEEVHFSNKQAAKISKIVVSTLAV